MFEEIFFNTFENKIIFEYLNRQFPGKFKIVITAMFHAENTYEPVVDRVEVKSIRPKPKPQTNLDEIFSIPSLTDWREISKNLDSYRPKVDLTPIPSDDEDFNSNVSSLASTLKFSI